MKSVIIINGSGGVGKDTFVNLCRKHTVRRVYNLSVIDPVKTMLAGAGIEIIKDESGRSFLSDIKNRIYEYTNVLMDNLISTVDSTEPDSIVFIHARDPQDIKYLVDNIKHKVTTLLIESNSRVPKITSNTADANVGNYDYDIVTNSDCSLSEYQLRAAEFVEIISQGVLPC